MREQIGGQRRGRAARTPMPRGHIPRSAAERRPWRMCRRANYGLADRCGVRLHLANGDIVLAGSYHARRALR